MFTGIRACVFDAYGTLFDFGSAAAGCADVLGEKAAPLTALWRDKQLQYSWLRGLQGRYVPFWQVTGEALDYAMETLGLQQDAILRARLMDLYLTLGIFPEVPTVLQTLRRAGFATAILSNGSPDMLASAVEGAGLVDAFDAVISVDEVGTFKPDRRVYQQALDRLGLPAEAIAFQSSNAWDAYAASAFGMRVVWCNRYGQMLERLPGAPDAEIRTLRFTTCTDSVAAATPDATAKLARQPPSLQPYPSGVGRLPVSFDLSDASCLRNVTCS